ncbi:MAG: ATP-binding protein [Methanosarcinaceae archaeon]|nr:ATP-binding protein [Methanosarcinaceae archaeon]
MSESTLDIVELLLTAHIYNQYSEMDVNDLPKNIRKNYWNRKHRNVPKPIHVFPADVEKLYNLTEVKQTAQSLLFVDIDGIDYELKLTSFDVAVEWFEKQDQSPQRVELNPALAFYFEMQKETSEADYKRARALTRPKEVDREWIESLIEEIENEAGGEDLLKLVKIIAPEDVRQGLGDLILTSEQESEIEKIEKAIQYREYLKSIGLYDIGKVLMVGPPGTGKTSVASALSEKLAIPFVEVKLSMVTDQYLGETAKNIDRVFELAKKLNPCILFIDEFDFVAKTRASDEHAALKRAVNTLLKAIDDISLTNDGVLLIAATNHPGMLDSAVWRRFDEIMDFPLPDMGMRKQILDIITREIEGEIDTTEIASLSEDYTGSDLRLVIRESVLGALLEDRKILNQQDLIKAINNFNKRAVIKSDEYMNSIV